MIKTIIVLFFSLYSFGKDFYYDTQGDNSLLIGEKGLYLTFDEPIRSLDPAPEFEVQKIKSESGVDTRSIYIEWRNPNSVKSKTSVFLSNRRIVNITLHYRNSDEFFKVPNTYTMIRKQKRVANERDNSNIEALNLIKQLVKRESSPKYKLYSKRIEVKDGIEKLRTRLINTVVGNKYVGYVFKVSNNSNKSYILKHNELKLGSPNKIMIHYLNTKVITPDSTSYLYIVAKRQSLEIFRSRKKRNKFVVNAYKEVSFE